MNHPLIPKVSRWLGWTFVILGVAGVVLGIVVLAVTGLTDGGTDEPTVYVQLIIVAATQFALGVALIRVFGTDDIPPPA